VFHQFYPLSELLFFYYCFLQPNNTTTLSFRGLFLCYKITQVRFHQFRYMLVSMMDLSLIILSMEMPMMEVGMDTMELFMEIHSL